jgi:hypothetical protein
MGDKDLVMAALTALAEGMNNKVDQFANQVRCRIRCTSVVPLLSSCWAVMN